LRKIQLKKLTAQKHHWFLRHPSRTAGCASED